MSIETVLIIGYVWPESRSSAAGGRMMDLIRLFRQQDWRVIFASPAQLSDHMDDLAALDVATVSIELNSSSFDHYVAELRPDLVLFDRFMMEEQFGWRVEQACPQALRVLETSDLHFLRHARQQAVKQGRTVDWPDLCSDLAKREVAAIYRSDLTLMISEVETQLLQERFGVSPALLHTLPFMLEPALTEQPLPAFEQRDHFVSIGNFRHPPNWDAVLWLKQQIWPLIRKRLPQAELHIYGAYPPPKATALHNPKQGFLVKGWAADAGEVMRNARLCLAPLRFGAGIKGKLADAMIFGTPNVTTEIGAEAMSGGLPWGGEIAENPAQIAAAAVALYQDRKRWLQAQQQGFDIIRHYYDRGRLGPALIDRLLDAQQQLESRRLANFTGQMLRHHHHKSTQYMSQWIEAKNRLAEQVACESDN